MLSKQNNLVSRKEISKKSPANFAVQNKIKPRLKEFAENVFKRWFKKSVNVLTSCVKSLKRSKNAYKALS
jgi:hypothetical protein